MLSFVLEGLFAKGFAVHGVELELERRRTGVDTHDFHLLCHNLPLSVRSYYKACFSKDKPLNQSGDKKKQKGNESGRKKGEGVSGRGLFPSLPGGKEG
jgi:hypothetical protein